MPFGDNYETLIGIEPTCLQLSLSDWRMGEEGYQGRSKGNGLMTHILVLCGCMGWTFKK
jgi:hypothetical protein